ncbi:hypothetical protein OPQ81_009963 [Rhizoctonia solani]|nr:hypothetical protein OPQ81_009963 [Rhizoctonia solani]
MSASYTVRSVGRLYPPSSVPFLVGLRFASWNAVSRGLSQKHIATDATTSKLSPRKPTLREVAPEKILRNPTTSNIMPARRGASDKRIPFQKPVPQPDPRLTPKTGTPAARQHPPRPSSRPPPTPTQYKLHRERIKKNYPEGWAPPRTISREAMEALRALHAEDPVQYRTPVLANKFKISPEAVSRILKSKWRPSPERTARLIARENMNRDKRITEKIRIERAEVVKALEGRLDIVEKAQGKDKLTMK